MKKSTTWKLLTAVCVPGALMFGWQFLALYGIAILCCGWPKFSDSGTTPSNEVSPETQALADQIAAKERRLREIDAAIGGR